MIAAACQRQFIELRILCGPQLYASFEGDRGITIVVRPTVCETFASGIFIWTSWVPTAR